MKPAKNNSLSVLLGAAFIMATSAIGPGFLTQTSHYTDLLKGSFGFVILISCILSLVVQINVWRVVCISGMHGQDIANKLLPGLGILLPLLIGAGGIVLTIGNVGGGALGFQTLFGLPQPVGILITGIIAIGIFLIPNATKAMDMISKILGISTIVIIFVIILVVHPPFGTALKETFLPSAGISDLGDGIRTLLGGTVGGYITFAGAHRLLDANITGKENEKQITSSSVMGIIIASVVRILLFLAVLGVVSASSGLILDESNPASDAFRRGAGEIGYRLFGIILLSASVTATIGCSYTTISFIKTLHPWLEKHTCLITGLFIGLCTFLMFVIGRPANLLILAGTLNGLIIPLILVICLVGATRSDIMGKSYKHPRWMTICGIITVIITGGLVLWYFLGM